MITAENITDEQIEELRREMRRLGGAGKEARRTVEECNLALNLPRGFDRDQWRARIARILNTRTHLASAGEGEK